MPQSYAKVPGSRLWWPWWVYELIIWSTLFGCAFAVSRGFFVWPAAAVFLAVFYGSFIECRLLTVKRFEVGTGERTLRVAFLSDIHVGPYKGLGWMRRVAARVQKLRPDVVLLGGDYVLSSGSQARLLEPLQSLTPPRGVYGILGNHDDYYDRATVERQFASMGIPLLVNRAVRIADVGVAIAGVDDDWYGDTEFKEAVLGVQDSDALIMLVHNPEVATHAVRETGRKPALILSGHDHGGQIRLPLLGSLARMPHSLGRKFDRGLFMLESDVPLIIGQGLGESGPRARLFCPPQIVFVTLRF